MPELPEVEGFRTLAENTMKGRTIVRARAFDDLMLQGLGKAAFARRLRGRRIVSADRRGKVLLLFTQRDSGDPPVLTLRFGMTGRLAAGTPPGPADRMVIDLDDGTSVRMTDPRRLGSIRLPGRTELSDLLWGLGPDALDMERSWFVGALRARRAAVKGVLLDQSFVAGLGNIWADESLHRAGIDPRRGASTLEAAEAARLYSAIRSTLSRAVTDNRRTPMAPLRLRLERSSGPCTTCGTPTEAAKVSGRTARWCPVCQR